MKEINLFEHHLNKNDAEIIINLLCMSSNELDLILRLMEFSNNYTGRV